jgi:hypothetical protein
MKQLTFMRLIGLPWELGSGVRTEATELPAGIISARA